MRLTVSTAAMVGLAAIAAPLAAADVELPTYTQAYEPQTVDERGMWMEADENERRLKESPLLIKDEHLQAYVRRVLCASVGSDRCSAVRIYILEVPGFNATMAPNGVMTVWSGLLLRVRSEAELGAVLGHEFAHFELRHSLRGFQNKRASHDMAAWASVLGGLANTDTRYLQYSLIGSMFRYDRDQEEQADLLGLRYLAASDYPSSAASGVWTNIMAEADATAAGRKLKARHRYSAGFFDTHPTQLRRASYLSEAAAKYADPGDPQAQGHARAMSSIMPRLLAAQVRLNDFGGSEFLLNELAEMHGWTPDLLYARGEMYQLRGNPRDLVTASQFYQEAIDKGLNTPAVHRDLGLALLKSGSTGQARPALEHYLELLPEAPDAPVIRTLLADH